MRDQFSPFIKILNGLLMAATKLQLKNKDLRINIIFKLKLYYCPRTAQW